MSESPPSLPNFCQETPILPAIAQDAKTNEILMLAYMNAESFAETMRTGRAVYFSRSRQRLWRKGEESGHVQHVSEILIDCDGDTILLRVQQEGAACHQGYRSCFFRRLTESDAELTQDRLVDPQEVYRTGDASPGTRT